MRKGKNIEHVEEPSGKDDTNSEEFRRDAKTLELEFLNQSSVSSSSSLYGLDRWCGAVANETEISYRVPHTDPTTQFQRCDGLELAPPSS